MQQGRYFSPFTLDVWVKVFFAPVGRSPFSF
jgi:hypothetical protein